MSVSIHDRAEEVRLQVAALSMVTIHLYIRVNVRTCLWVLSVSVQSRSPGLLHIGRKEYLVDCRDDSCWRSLSRLWWNLWADGTHGYPD